MSVSLQQSAGRPPYVVFQQRQIEDRTASTATGKYATKTVDIAIIRQSGSSNSNEIEANDWLERISHNPGYPPEWVDGFRKHYALWKQGQEAPLNGTPIREWGAISPDQRNHMLQLLIMTVEDLAAANESTLMRIGMGGRELKQKAQTWLNTANDVGKAAAELGALRVENAAIKDEMEKLRKMIFANQSPSYAVAALPNNGLPVTIVPQVAMPIPAVEEDPFA